MASAMVSETMGCTFESCLGNYSGVVQWPGPSALNRKTGVRFTPPELHRGIAQIEERLFREQEVEMAEFSTPTMYSLS
jgi:hypothetical protein